MLHVPGYKKIRTTVLQSSSDRTLAAARGIARAWHNRGVKHLETSDLPDGSITIEGYAPDSLKSLIWIPQKPDLAS